MQKQIRFGQKFSRKKAVLVFFLCAVAVFAILFSSCSGTGICVGTGGVLSSPECKEGWSKEECEEWDAQGINGADWIYYTGSCADQGYTEKCPDGSYRLPGQC